MMSIGLPWLQVAGSTALSFSIVAGDSAASRPPSSISRSVASTPAPPPLVTIASRLPRCGEERASVVAASNNSSTSLTRSMPARRNAAS